MNISSELKGILEKFTESGWDLITGPSKAYLDGDENTDALIAAVREADKECGSCGCEYDVLYKRALQLLDGKPAKVSTPASNNFCPQTLFLYGTYKEDSTPNFGLFCWLSYCWKDGLCVMASIGGGKLTKDRIQATGVFSANLVTEPLLPLADYLGNTKGYDEDKMNIPLSVMKGAVLDVPVLSDSPVSFELEVDQSVSLGGNDIYICKIRNVLLNEALSDKSISVKQHLQSVLPVRTTCQTYISHNGQAMGAWGEPMQSFEK